MRREPLVIVPLFRKFVAPTPSLVARPSRKRSSIADGGGQDTGPLFDVTMVVSLRDPERVVVPVAIGRSTKARRAATTVFRFLGVEEKEGHRPWK